MNIECPNCKKVMELDEDDLSSRACDEVEIECHNCDDVFNVGWYATAELR